MSVLKPARKTGRCANGGHGDGGVVLHAVEYKSQSWDAALCGTKPGRLSAGWDFEVDFWGGKVTCERCLGKMKKR
jgi:hypothetical protein